MTTWKELFDYLEGKLEFGDGVTTALSASCKHDHADVLKFSKHHKLNNDYMIRLVRSYGGYCDCEVLFNMVDRIDEELEIPTTENEMKVQLGPSDDEERPGDTFCFMVENSVPGWEDGYKSRAEAEAAKQVWIKQGYKIETEPMIDFNERAIRHARKK